jgi:ribonucleoside-diphosphate reductase alpha chain
MFLKEYWNYAKLISGILRHGMPLPNVVNLIDKLRLDDDNIMTWKNGVARALKRYIKEGTKIKQACPECKQETLIYKDGCVTCMNCGHSKCG